MKKTSELLTKHISNQLNTDGSIRLQNVNTYLSKRDAIQVRSKLEAYTSFVSSGANSEFEIGIMDMESTYVTSNARYGLVAIDKFTRIAEVVPIKHRTPEAMIGGLNNIFTSWENQHSYIQMENLL